MTPIHHNHQPINWEGRKSPITLPTKHVEKNDYIVRVTPQSCDIDNIYCTPPPLGTNFWYPSSARQKIEPNRL